MYSVCISAEGSGAPQCSLLMLPSTVHELRFVMLRRILAEGVQQPYRFIALDTPQDRLSLMLLRTHLLLHRTSHDPARGLYECIGCMLTDFKDS